LTPGLELSEAALCILTGIMDLEPGIFVSELDAIAHPEIDVDIRSVGDGLVAEQKRDVCKIDFPVEMAGVPGSLV
jgi:hypothetical protein